MRNLLSLVACCFWACTLHAQPIHGFLVQLKPSANERELPQERTERAKRVQLDVGMAELPGRSIGRVEHIRLKTPLASVAHADAQLRRLRLHPDVLHVEPDVMLKPLRVPNDASFSRLWHLEAPSSSASAAINAVGAWDISTGRAVTVAVLDSGIRPHADLAGKVLPGYDFVSEVDYANDGNGRDNDPTDPGDWVTSADIARSNALYGGCDVANSSWHGTFIAGLIGAAANNAQGISGVSWGARILPVRVAGKCGALLSDLLDGMRWAAGLSVAGVPNNANPAKIINVSFGGSTRCANSAYQPVIDEVTAAGALVVVAAGNEAGPPTRPADCRNVLSVGAVRADGLKTSYSNFGSTLTFMTTGGSTENGGVNRLYSTADSGLTVPIADTYAFKQGTSFSAPVAAGIAALMLGLNPNLSPAELTARLKRSVRDFPFNAGFATCSSSATGICNCNVNVCGAGLLDAAMAVQQALIPQTKIAPTSVLVNGVTTPYAASVVAGSTLLLDARGTAMAVSNDAGFGPLVASWRQLDGPVANFSSGGAYTTSLALGAAAGTVLVELRLTDTAGRTSTDTASFVVTAVAVQPTPAPAAAPSGGGGALPDNWLWFVFMVVTFALAHWPVRLRMEKKK